ncbi:MAG: short-chain dehydrogenase [Methylobacterium sp.]|nr:short-chain dehydrogenase [Methylobacterium sp.]
MTPQRIAVVTGAGSGIGRATALRLASDGDHVIVAERDPESASRVAGEIESAGGSAETAVLDVTDAAALDTAISRLTRIDVLVNNAGILSVKPFEDLRPDDYRRMFEVNVIAVAEVSRRVVARMPRGGAIVNLSSRAIFGAVNYAHYIAAKSAVAGLNRAMALEFADRGIRVNAVAPGAIKTPMLALRTDTDESAFLRHQPLGRLGMPEDIAAAIAFLASPQASFVTGQMLLVDGGRSLGGPYGF